MGSLFVTIACWLLLNPPGDAALCFFLLFSGKALGVKASRAPCCKINTKILIIIHITRIIGQKSENPIKWLTRPFSSLFENAKEITLIDSDFKVKSEGQP